MQLYDKNSVGGESVNIAKLKAIYELAKPIMELLETEDPYIKVVINDNEVCTVRIEDSIKKQSTI